MIEFIEETHQYLVEGILTPSVTQILKKVFPHKYEGVDERILEQKSIYGTKLHKCIEMIEKKKPKKPIAYCKRYLNIDIYQEESLKQYLAIKEKYNIEVLESEKQVQYKGLYAGTLDMVAKVNGKVKVIDIKTTYELDKEYVGWQDSYYELAYHWQEHKKVDGLMCLWLPKKHLGDLYEVERIDKEKLIKELEI